MKTTRILYLLTCLWTCISLTAHTPYNKFRLIDVRDGLFNNQVRFLTQLQDGRILAYTEGMFNVYNGNTFESLECDLSQTVPLGMHNICTCYDVGNGLLWAKDFYNLYLIDTRTLRFCRDIKERFAPSGITEAFHDFILDSDKQAWIITTDGGVYRYDWQHPARLIYRPTPAEQDAGLRVADVIQAGPFHLIFMNNGKILYWEEKTATFIGEDLTLASSSPSVHFRMTWLPQDNRNLLISISHPRDVLYTFNIYTREWKEVLRNQSINDIKKAQDGSFWLGGDYTLIHLSADLRTISDIREFRLTQGQTINDIILSVLLDKHQGVWLGMSCTGILKAVPQNRYAEHYTNTAAKSEQGRFIRTLKPYDDEHLLVGTLQGVYLFHTKEKTFTPFHPETLGDIHCTDIKQDASGAFWLSSRSGLFHIHQDKVTHYDKRTHGLPSDTVRFMQPLASGNLLLCQDLVNLIIYNPNTGAINRLGMDDLSLQRSRALSFVVEMRPGQLLIGGQSGLFGYEKGKKGIRKPEWIKEWEHYSNKFNCALQEESALWLGTQNGLIYHDFKLRKTSRFSREDGLPNSCIQGITKDRDNNLWVSTPNGVCKIHRSKDDTFFFTSLDEVDGVRHGEMMEQSIAAMPDGHVYVGGINSITDLPSQITEYAGQEEKPLLVGLRIMDTTIDNEGMFHGRQIVSEGLSNARTIRLRYDENAVVMKFSALNYETPQHTRYRYKLTEVDKDWIQSTSPTGICTATYTSLPQGQHELQVQASIDNRNWSAPTRLTIVVTPPLWKTWWAYTLYIISVLAAAYLIIELYINNKRSRMMAEQESLKHQKEQQLDELKFRFFTNISHEFRTPLALIITPLELLIRKTADSRLKEELEKILGNAKELLRLINQLLDFRRLEQKGEQLKLSAVQIRPFIENCVDQFMELAQEHNLSLSCECQFTEEDMFYIDTEKITRVLNNLLSNAIKFTPQGGVITVSALWTDVAQAPNSGIRICVSDTGIGISANELKHIFVRFYQSENSPVESLNTGSGIGLHLTKGYVELHHGTITAESEPGKGTTFTVTLPHPDTAQTPSSETPGIITREEPTDNTSINGKDHDITILIVEDNEQFRNFMKTLLQNDYRVLTSPDGVEGLEKARQYAPDLIISDIMMPNMDGYTFCRTIKADVNCSHIPVILLTAKNSSESRAGAYEAKADSFIAKPFDIDVLSSRIRQLLEQRKQRHDRFRTGIEVSPKEITITNLDEQLIQKALDCIEKNMDNAEYNVEALSADMGIERSSLYRKMQAIIGQTPSEFIRTIRLKRAAQLLEHSTYSVQEISWMVGFNTPRYFSSYFKEMFGVIPSKYGKRGEKSE